MAKASRKAVQSKNVVGGDQAAGDINKTSITILPEARRTIMQTLLQRLREEVEAGRTVSEPTDTLKFYLEPLPAEPLDLEEKLRLGEREADIERALRLKEIFAKRLHKHQLYLSAPVVSGHKLKSDNWL